MEPALSYKGVGSPPASACVSQLGSTWKQARIYKGEENTALRPPQSCALALLFLVQRHLLMSPESCAGLQSCGEKMTNISAGGGGCFIFRSFRLFIFPLSTSFRRVLSPPPLPCENAFQVLCNWGGGGGDF